ncbi:MAG: hypothetical protein CL484_01645, partial [Acidobacteria bacterium]|nr:hypothetical protein [Acidobacteriota bacterium]
MTANQSAKRLPYFLALIVGLALTSFTVATPLAAAEGALTLISAVKSGKVEFVQQALAENMSVDTTEPDGATALHWAA